MNIDILTIFPHYFDSVLTTSLLGKAIERDIVRCTAHDLRRWTHDVHKSVDASPFGGGAGMLMRPEPFFEAVDELYGSLANRPRTLLMTPRGKQLDQQLAQELATEDDLLILCGRYEGIDERVHLHLATDEIAVGNAVLSGGEVAAAVTLEAVTRLIPGVMGNVQSGIEESFSEGLVEFPQYTRPAEYRGWSVPPVLRSGNHRNVATWRHAQSLAKTRLVRPDLYNTRNSSHHD